MGNDAVPGFSAQTLPAGSAPADRTYQPPLLPAQNLFYASSELRTAAKDAMHGATSADVNKGVGQPLYGQTSRELRGKCSGRKARRGGRKERNGLAGVGVDPRDPVKERALDSDFPKDRMGKRGLNWHTFAGAEDKMPQGAEAVAAERD